MNDRPVIEVRNIRKRFGQVTALNGVDFSVRSGEIHGLLGENGAGKSTLMNILYGLYQPDAGEVRVDDKPVHIGSPADSIRLGIGMVHQASTVVPSYTAFENIVLGTRRSHFNRTVVAQQIRSLGTQYGFEFPLDTKVEQLAFGERQRIEIVRALYRGARILILDEPTTSLVEHEVDKLRDSLQALAHEGLACVFITHKIREVFGICDTATVLRKGVVQGFTLIKESSKDELVALMFGDQDIKVSENALPVIDIRPMTRTKQPVCELIDVGCPSLHGADALEGVALQIVGGEILGVAGVSGNGQRELAAAIMNPTGKVSGQVLLGGERMNECSTAEILSRGVAFVPEDRMREAILPAASLVKNFLLPHFNDKHYRTHRVFIDWRRVAEEARKVIGEFNVVATSETEPIMHLSGGNIQKLVLGRALTPDVQLLLAYNPCAGLDVATVESILQRMVDLRDKGRAVLWINDDLDELMICSDRIAVLYKGTLRGIVSRAEFDKYHIGGLMTGSE